MRRFVLLLLLVFGSVAMGEAQGQPAAAQTDATPAGRKGFIIGLSGGIGFKRESIPATRSTINFNTTGAITDFKIGYAPRDQVLVYYTNQVAWGESLSYDAIGMSAVGVTYMLKPTSPSAFVSGAVGGSLGLSISSTSSSSPGLGVSLGGGYEFARHFSVGARWMSLDVGYPNRSNVFGFTFDWLFY